MRFGTVPMDHVGISWMSLNTSMISEQEGISNIIYHRDSVKYPDFGSCWLGKNKTKINIARTYVLAVRFRAMNM